MAPLTRKRKLEQSQRGPVVESSEGRRKSAPKTRKDRKALKNTVPHVNLRPESHYQQFYEKERTTDIRHMDFFALPAEVRIQIYGELIQPACVTPLIFRDQHDRYDCDELGARIPFPLGLLTTCSQAHHGILAQYG
ncbi:hypothetical protein EJ08DRAFT_51562 [Tothia fuscella]|uniref:Uncharacterized protein n=1 Tax=Tothia fuscella TaxID=1048955 RepID=A0A9P4TT68_9PEZI|nr:hypothetical protein EJ08DRAFT_51562 [Tothia fuscella]